MPTRTITRTVSGVQAPPSKSQVNKAGRCLRQLLRGNIPLDSTEIHEAIEVVLRFRAAHQTPLAKANMGLRSVVRSTDCQRVEVSQRLKRVPTLLNKLGREPTLALANMQDIGGCRAVLDSIAEVRRVEARLKKNRPPVRVSDYIAQPRASGYRAVHLVVVYDDRRIEVQLRTRVMHSWAVAVERLSGRLDLDLHLKESGDHVLQRLFRAISEAMELEEQGRVVDAELLAIMDDLRIEAAPYLARRG